MSLGGQSGGEAFKRKANNDRGAGMNRIDDTLPDSAGVDSDSLQSGPPAIATTNLTKTFGKRVAVKDFSIQIPAGRIVGFVGPNGAGKTTTIRMLLGLIRPTSGTGRVLGELISTPAAYLHRVGALIETPAFYPTLSGRENLHVLCSLGSINSERIDDLLDEVGLAERDRDNVGGYSLGMKQRLGVAAALLPDPDLLVLDEPANGLDPEGIIEIRELMVRLRNQGKTLFVSSHLLGEVEQVADWLVMIKNGEAIFSGPTHELMAHRTGGLMLATGNIADLNTLRDLTAHMGYESSIDGRYVHVSAPPDAAGPINESVMKAGVTLTVIRPVQATLEETFLDMVAGDSNV
jgi:ABC-2 type transport system ATP-binding protein